MSEFRRLSLTGDLSPIAIPAILAIQSSGKLHCPCDECLKERLSLTEENRKQLDQIWKKGQPPTTFAACEKLEILILEYLFAKLRFRLQQIEENYNQEPKNDKANLLQEFRKTYIDINQCLYEIEVLIEKMTFMWRQHVKQNWGIIHAGSDKRLINLAKSIADALFEYNYPYDHK